MTLLIPVPSIDELARVMGSDRIEQVQMFACDNAAIFSMNGDKRRVLMSAQLVDAKYPDYATIIPKSAETTVVADKAAFVRLLQMARLFAEGEKRSARLVIGESCLRVASHRAVVGESAGEIEAQIDGKPLEIVLDVGFLLDTLAQIDTERVALEGAGRNRPFCLRPEGVASEEALHVIMPMGGKD